ncbi:unnamed protein product [Danaus chrysippus]|uniref:(African queen) hypothetical protein n=1 Tax=Danaus chrysippus TaxID=151541 RepID=A0A8J2R8P0_9NEOP|nr:unnamed protein product [Danaus chrysippus]
MYAFIRSQAGFGRKANGDTALKIELRDSGPGAAMRPGAGRPVPSPPSRSFVIPMLPYGHLVTLRSIADNNLRLAGKDIEVELQIPLKAAAF